MAGAAEWGVFWCREGKCFGRWGFFKFFEARFLRDTDKNRWRSSGVVRFFDCEETP